MRSRLVELQVEDNQIRKIRVKKLDRNKKDSNKILNYQGLFYIFEIIRTNLISKYYNDPLVSYFKIEKTQKIFIKKYCFKTICYNVKVYFGYYNVWLILKTVKHKHFEDL